MRILITGGTGLIGRALCQLWISRGDDVVVWSRNPEQVAALCGDRVQGIAHLEALDDRPLDAVVNLAGAPIADRPWSRARRKLLWDSRVALTEQLVGWLARRTQRPSVLVSGSAVGIYGDRGEDRITESEPVGTDFASQLCGSWEEAAKKAQELGIRVALVRTGLVLAPQGGFLGRLKPVFRLGLGGPLGQGNQWMPWVHLEDEVALIDFLLHHDSASGPYNACAPVGVRNADFTRQLAKALHRPALLPAPAPLLRLGLGELSILLLGGQQGVPERLQQAGFEFRFTTLESALADLFLKN